MAVGAEVIIVSIDASVGDPDGLNVIDMDITAGTASGAGSLLFPPWFLPPPPWRERVASAAWISSRE